MNLVCVNVVVTRHREVDYVGGWLTREFDRLQKKILESRMNVCVGAGAFNVPAADLYILDENEEDQEEE